MEHKHLSIIMPNLLTWDGKNPVIGGLERYVWNLIDVLKEAGISPDVHQNGDHDWEHEVNGVKVRGYGLAKISMEAAIQQIHATTGRVLYASILYQPVSFKPNSAVISHGVWWDWAGYGPRGPGVSLSICRQALEQAEIVVSCDYNFLNVMRATFSELSGKIIVIPNFVDTAVFKPRYPSEKNIKEITILYPRRIDVCRGIDLFLNAGIRIMKKYPTVRLHLAVDANHPEFNEKVQKYLSSVEERRRITMKNYRFEDMPGVYNSADIVVIPSLFSEGTSFSSLEAMASGCALVVTDVGGLTNLVFDGYNGLIIRPDEDELVSALETIIENPELRATLGERARSVAESFSINRWKERWHSIIERVYPDLL